ncbi:MAG: Trk family potassium uptake protein [Chloroflexota bacterium]|nr:Trk family potassium uptake protein [Chloroflexota bacterium]
MVIPLPPPRERSSVPSVRSHAKLFALGLLVVIAVGTVLLATPWTTENGSGTPAVDALFTAVSAAAVTGLITVETQDHWNFWGELVILILIQVGGLGFMVGASLVLQTLRRGQTRLSDAVLIQNGAPTLSLREAGHLARRVVRFTFVTEAIGAILLTVRFARDMPVLEALWYGTFHSVSAFCNAGFDLQGGYRSFLPFQTDAWVNVVIMLLIQAGALSYVALADVAGTRRWSRLALDTKLVLVANAALLVLGTVTVLAAEWNHALADTPASSRPMAALFQSVAARTAGFATMNFSEVHTVTLFIWIGIMLIGGASGSTAGGVKLTTAGVVAAAVISTLRGGEEPTAFGRRLATPLVLRAMAVIALMFLAHFTATALLAITEHLAGGADASFIALMFEAMSALATVGLSTGITPALSTAGKLVLCGAMFFGRLGPLTAAYALQRRQRPVRYRLPVAPVRIG